MKTQTLIPRTTCPKTMAGRLRKPCATRLLALLFLLTLPGVLEAQFTYTTNNGAITITGYTGPGGAVTIPGTINGSPVTSIGDNAFAHCASLTSVTIPDSVINIGYGAFMLCPKLSAINVNTNNRAYSGVAGVLFNENQTTLIQYPAGKAGSYTIPGSVTSIGDNAFYYCTSLASVTIPDSVTSIGDNAFCCCTSLRGVTIPNSVTSIGDSALMECYSLTNLTVGSGVTNIGVAAFDGCTSLKAITVDPLNSSYSSVGGLLFNKSQTTLFQYPGGKTGTYTIPNSVTSIGACAFLDCTTLTGVTIGNSVASIGNQAFNYCTSLTAVIIPNSVTSIGVDAFLQCSSLTKLTIGSGVTSIADAAFQSCSNLTSVYFQGNAPSLGSDVFGGDNNVTVYYLAGTTGWGTTFGGRPTALWNLSVQYTVATGSFPASGGSVSGGGSFVSGSSVTVTATPSLGYTFVNWTENGAQVSASASYTFSVTTNRALTANFAPLYTVAASAAPAADGSVSGGGSFVSNSSVTVTATPSLGYAFVNWTENGVQVSPSASYTFTVTTNRALTANFAPLYTVTASASPRAGGSISGGGTCTNGDFVVLIATASPGYHFLDWTENGVVLSISNSLSFTVATNRSLVGYFAMNPTDTLTVTAAPTAGGRVSGGGTFEAGSSRTVTAAPNAGYIFATWTENGGIVSGSARYTVTLRGDRNLVANFIPNPFPGVSGTYSGLFADETNGVSQHSCGCFTITVAAKGAYTASLQVGGGRYSLIGQFDFAGTASQSIARPNAHALTVNLQLDLASGTDRVTGSVSDGTWTSALAGDRAIYDGRTKLAPEAGSYTMILAGAYGSANEPAGDSYGTFTVGKNGAISFTGTLADGTKVTPSAPVSKYGQWPFYASLYGGQGVLWSWLAFTNASDLGGPVAWVKLPLKTQVLSCGLLPGCRGARGAVLSSRQRDQCAGPDHQHGLDPDTGGRRLGAGHHQPDRTCGQ